VIAARQVLACVTPQDEHLKARFARDVECDIRDFATLERILWRLCEKTSSRLKSSELAGSTITLKLKTADFRQRTRSQSIAAPTQLAAKIFSICREMLISISHSGAASAVTPTSVLAGPHIAANSPISPACFRADIAQAATANN